MGQYHGLYNLDMREMVFPHEFGWGAKQVEHTGYRGAMLPDILYVLCAFRDHRGDGDLFDDFGVFKGRWHGDRVAVIGDHAEVKDLPDVWQVAFATDGEYVGSFIGEKYFTNIAEEIKPAYRILFSEHIRGLDITSLREKYGEVKLTRD